MSDPSKTVEVCGICGEKVGDPCRHRLSGQIIGNNYRHKQGIHHVSKWVSEAEYLKDMERRERAASNYKLSKAQQ